MTPWEFVEWHQIKGRGPVAVVRILDYKAMPKGFSVGAVLEIEGKAWRVIGAERPVIDNLQGLVVRANE